MSPVVQPLPPLLDDPLLLPVDPEPLLELLPIPPLPAVHCPLAALQAIESALAVPQ
jgi:hypothetical protein